MKIKSILSSHRSFSLEVFPPKSDQPIDPLLETLNHLYAFQPDFISVTYGAGGTNRGRNMEVIRSILQSSCTDVLAHFTCIGNTMDQIASAIQEYSDTGVENVLALRGDLPKGWEGTNGDFHHADELIRFISSIRPGFSIGAACYPETHLEAMSPDSDLDVLLRKQDAGAEFLVSQLCHDPDSFSRFLDKVRKHGISIPILVGIMPVLSKDPIIRVAVSNGCSIPASLSALIGKYGDDPAVFRSAGKEFTVSLIRRYIDSGVDGIHIYTMNRYLDVSEILENSGFGKEGYSDWNTFQR